MKEVDMDQIKTFKQIAKLANPFTHLLAENHFYCLYDENCKFKGIGRHLYDNTTLYLTNALSSPPTDEIGPFLLLHFDNNIGKIKKTPLQATFEQAMQEARFYSNQTWSETKDLYGNHTNLIHKNMLNPFKILNPIYTKDIRSKQYQIAKKYSTFIKTAIDILEDSHPSKDNKTRILIWRDIYSILIEYIIKPQKNKTNTTKIENILNQSQKVIGHISGALLRDILPYTKDPLLRSKIVHLSYIAYKMSKER